MDYSQFLMMPQELGLLLVFALVFIYDTFMPSRSQRFLPCFTAILFAIYTALSFVPCVVTGMAFSGMFETTAATWVMKNILNVGVLLVLLQAAKWSNGEFVSVRRGEFYELLLLTLLGMFIMISARHFLLFVIGLETASLPIAALAAFEKNHYESHEAAAKYMFTAIFSQDAPPPTCMEVNGMEATVDDSGRVWLSWASGVDGLHVGWEVAWGLDGTPAYQCNTRRCGTATTIDSLEKGQWYVAYVRAICMHDSTEYYSDWSRGVRVYIPLDIKYTVTAVANYEERGYVEGGGVYEEGAIATLTAHAAEPYGFLRWNDGSTANSRYVTVTQDTSFTALFVNRDGVATVDSLGRMFKLLPNPASGSVRCLMEGKPFPGGVLTMADASGRKMLHRELPPLTTSHTITLTAYPKGVYFVTLTTTEGSSTQRLVIE